jgi:DNA-binding XRE family transcriptional regulator
VELAAAIEVHKTTMNGYEKGKRGMDEATLERIAAVLQCETLEIWEDAFGIFRYNHLREQAQKKGTTAEELVGRTDQGPSLDRVHAGFRTLTDNVWAFISEILTYLRPGRYNDPGSAATMWGVVVDAPAKSTKALQFQRKRKAAPDPESPPPGS